MDYAPVLASRLRKGTVSAIASMRCVLQKVRASEVLPGDVLITCIRSL